MAAAILRTDALLQMRVDFDNRTCVRLLRMHEVVNHADEHYSPGDYDRKIHLGKVGDRSGWPAAEEDDQREIANGDDIVGNAKSAFEPPRTPCQASVVRFIDLTGAEDSHRRIGVVQVAA